MTRDAFDAVIIGAGPAGSSAAILLARAGWTVALVEKQSFPRRKVCGECIAASNLPLLDALGIGPAFEAAAGPELRTMTLMRGSRQARADLPAADGPTHRWGRALGRETLDTLLLEQARSVGAVVLQPWSVLAIDGAVGDWHLRVRASDTDAVRTLHAPVAIAAHGSWEALPAARPRLRASRSASDLLAFKANFRDASLPAGVLPVLSFDGGYGGMVLADDGVTTVACCIRRDALDAARRAAPGARAGEAVESLLKRECSGVRDALQTAVRDGTWLAAGPIAPGVRLRADDTLLRIGNAAGEAHPIIGAAIRMAAVQPPARRRGLGGCDRRGMATRGGASVCTRLAAGVRAAPATRGGLRAPGDAPRRRRALARVGPGLARAPDAGRALGRQGALRGRTGHHRASRTVRSRARRPAERGRPRRIPPPVRPTPPKDMT